MNDDRASRRPCAAPRADLALVVMLAAACALLRATPASAQTVSCPGNTLSPAPGSLSLQAGNSYNLDAGTYTVFSVNLATANTLCVRGSPSGNGTVLVMATQGGIQFSVGSGASLSLDTLTLKGNLDSQGISVQQGATLVTSRVTMSGWSLAITANNAGASMTIKDTTFSFNGDPRGPGASISSYSSISFSGQTTFSDNTCAYGCGINVASAPTSPTFTFNGPATFQRNMARSYGAGISVESPGGLATFDFKAAVSFVDNVATGSSPAGGAGISVVASAVIFRDGVRMSGNKASTGAAVKLLGGTMSVTGSTCVSGNSATSTSGPGGAWYLDGSAAVTFAGPAASQGFGSNVWAPSGVPSGESDITIQSGSVKCAGGSTRTSSLNVDGAICDSACPLASADDCSCTGAFSFNSSSCTCSAPLRGLAITSPTAGSTLATGTPFTTTARVSALNVQSVRFDFAPSASGSCSPAAQTVSVTNGAATADATCTFDSEGPASLLVAATGGGVSLNTTASFNILSTLSLSASAGDVVENGFPMDVTAQLGQPMSIPTTITFSASPESIDLTCTPRSVTLAAGEKTATSSCITNNLGQAIVNVAASTTDGKTASTSVSYSVNQILEGGEPFLALLADAAPSSVYAGGSSLVTATLSAALRRPVAVVFSSDTAACTPSSVQLTGIKTTTSTCRFPVAGDATVSVTATSNGGQQPTADVQVSVSPVPAAQMTSVVAAPGSLVVGQTSTVTAVVQGGTAPATFAFAGDGGSGITCSSPVVESSTTPIGLVVTQGSATCTFSSAGVQAVKVVATSGQQAVQGSASVVAEPMLAVASVSASPQALTPGQSTVITLQLAPGSPPANVSFSPPQGAGSCVPPVVELAAVGAGPSAPQASSNCTLSTSAVIQVAASTKLQFTGGGVSVNVEQLLAFASLIATPTDAVINGSIKVNASLVGAIPGTKVVFRSRPAGLSCRPASVTATQIALTACKSPNAGTFTVAASATSPARQAASKSVVVHVEQPLSIASLSATAGGKVGQPSTLTAVLGAGGVPGAVLKFSSKPAGLTCRPSSVTWTKSTVSAATNCTSARARTYTVMLTATTAARQQATQTVGVTVSR